MNSEDRSVLATTMTSHAIVHAQEMSIPLFMVLWLTDFSLSKAWLGTLVTLGYFLFGAGSLPSGLFADELGSTRMIVACLGGMGTGFLLLGMAGGSWGLAAGLVVWGISASIHHPASLSLISQSVSQRGTGFAYHGMAAQVGTGGGPLLTSFLLGFFSWQTVCYLMAAPAFAGMLAALTIREGSTDSPGSEESVDPSKKRSVSSVSEFRRKLGILVYSPFVILFCVVVLEGIYYRGLLSFLPDLLGSRYQYSFILAAGLLGQLAGGKLSDRMNSRHGLGTVLIVLSLLTALFAFTIHAGTVPRMINGVLLGFVLFMAQPLYQAAVAETTGREVRGLAYGFAFVAIFGVGSVGATMAGFILEIYSQSLLFTVLTLLVLGAAAVVFSYDLVAPRKGTGAEQQPHEGEKEPSPGS